MRKKLLALALVEGLGALMFLSCGGPGGKTLQNALGGVSSNSVVVLGGDTPLCDVLSFQVTITGITLTPAAGGAPVSVLSSGQAITVDFAELMDFSALLNLASVPTGTFSQVTLTLANPQLTVLDTAKIPPAVTTVSTTVNPLTVTVNLNPAFTLDTTVVMQVDFNLLKSVQTSSSGQVTGIVNPVFSINFVNSIAPQNPGLAELEDFRGVVNSVNTTGSGSFKGSFVAQTGGANGPARTVEVNGSTTFDGVSGLGALLVGDFVEVDAFVDSTGNIVAKIVEVEDQEDFSQAKAAFVGLVTSVTSVSGNATQLALFVREESPDVSGTIPLKTLITVNIAPTTRFKVSAVGTNLAQLQFGAANVAPGQQLVVHGVFQSSRTLGVPAVLAANSIFLTLQSVVGNFSKLLAAGTDGKTGGFVLLPCSGIFQEKSLTALTFAGTAFAEVTNLSGLTTQPTLVVKGLLFFEPTLASSGTVTLTPPSLVVVAKQVRQLQ